MSAAKRPVTKRTPSKSHATKGAAKTSRAAEGAAKKRAAQPAPTGDRRSPRALKSAPSRGSVAAFLASLDEAVRGDCAELDRLMRAATGADGTMYGASIVGYGSSTIRYADGREAPWMRMGFSPRKQALTLYGVLSNATAARLGALGPHSTGKGCLYVKRLSDVDGRVLRGLIEAAAR